MELREMTDEQRSEFMVNFMEKICMSLNIEMKETVLDYTINELIRRSENSRRVSSFYDKLSEWIIQHPRDYVPFSLGMIFKAIEDYKNRNN